MNRTLSVIVFLAVAPLLQACAIVTEHHKDVTGDPEFQVAYRRGEVYRVSVDAKLVWFDHRRRGLFELWPREKLDAMRSWGAEEIADIPAGSTVRVGRLAYNFYVNFPPVPGDTMILKAYGTLETADGRRWRRVRLPGDEAAGLAWVGGAWVSTYPRDMNLLELIDAPAPPADDASPTPTPRE